MLTQKEFDNLNIGDVIIAKRPYKNRPGHEYSPHIVIDKKNNYVICVQGNSNVPSESDFFKLLKIKHPELDKDTFCRCNYLYKIYNKNCTKFLFSLSKNELEEIKRILVLNKYVIKNTFDSIDEDINLYKEGDIIKYKNNSLFLIIDTSFERNRCILLSASKREDASKKIIVDNEILYYKIDTIYDLYKKGALMGRIADITLKNIKKEVNDYNNEINKITRGSIIKKENNYYYVYDDNNKELLVSPLEINKDDVECKIQIHVNNIPYFVKYNKELILNNDNIEIIKKLNDETIELIKKNKKNYKKTFEDKKNKNELRDSIREYNGYIVYGKTLAKEKYIVINSNSIKSFNLYDVENKRIITNCTRSKYTLGPKLDQKTYKELLHYLNNVSYDEEIIRNLILNNNG